MEDEFYKKWNIPKCIATADGKHIRIFCLGRSGLLYFNYKDFFSIVLLAFVDINYKFLTIDVSSYGKKDDIITVPFVIVGDGAFRLSKYVMKPYTRSAALIDVNKFIFKYRLSRARRVAENAFALLS
ncbi:uncharacterized protein [Euwallacea similis]|uniref:uncharacterized protein n=1 Tax=Euwallacea similis TaxID=1736056 RepID=UPI00344E5B83